jgi:hypothetical protein
VKEAQAIKAALEARFAVCGLTMHPAKTKIVYCKDKNRAGTHDHTKFTFLGYEFRQRYVKNSKTGKLFANFTAAVSPAALTEMRQKARRLNYRKRTDLSLQDIASKLNPILRGWIGYYGRFQPSALCPLFRHIDRSLIAWTMRKYKRFRNSMMRAGTFIKKVCQKCPALFVHWKLGMAGASA